MEKNRRVKHLIIGGVAGGATAAARIRRNDEKAEIILFEKGEYISYANCGLPYYIGGTIEERDSLFVQTPESFGQRFNIDVRTRNEVIEIDTEKKQVKVIGSDDRVYTESYDKLLLSPGATAVKPPIKGIDSDGIFTLRNVYDTDRIKEYITKHRVNRAVIVGGGFIGLEMAENLYDTGAKVSVVEMAPQVMAPIDFSMAQIVHEHLVTKGVELYLGEGVVSFENHNDKINVMLSSGKSLPADIVILSIGVRPTTNLARDANIAIGEVGGIRVDNFMQTSAEGVYAVGDAIEFQHPLLNKPWLNLLAGPANRQARIAADNMVFGNHIEYEGSIGTAIAKVFDITVASTGVPAKRLRELNIPYITATIHPNSHAHYYPGAKPMTIKIVFSPDKGKLLGAQIVGVDGVDKRIDSFAMAIKQGLSITSLMEIEHAYAPPYSSAKDPVAISAYVASNILNGKMTPLYWRDLLSTNREDRILIDVRTPEEYALGTIEGAINIELEELRKRLDEIPNDKPIFLFCSVGIRGYLASNILKANGYRDVRNLIGGIRTYNTATADYTKAVPNDVDVLKSHTSENSNIAKVVVDACGLQCPGPILRLRDKISTLKDGECIEIMATDSAFTRDVEAWCISTGNRVLTTSCDKGIYRAVVQRGTKENSTSKSIITTKNDEKTFVMFSDDLDKTLATFVLANGAAATGKRVTIFFTFWGLNAIKRVNKPRVKKDIWGKMFGWMLPSHSKQLSLSKFNMFGLGRIMMRHLIKLRGVDSLENLRRQALDNGVEFIACQMSMDVMGIKREELIDEVSIGGVATYIERAEKSDVNLFI
ncbi:MAG: FAD-dependent oxidoreductase [Bacteroidaceae bacterium]|nr:FAD-dependent oxidoreductase [Bacteroidaceae bacterium]